MGCDNTTLLVSNGAKIWVRNVPIGGNHFTRALTKEMKLTFAKAEHLKCNATKSPDPRAVFQALRPVFNDYVSEIQRSIGYFSSVNREAKIAKVHRLRQRLQAGRFAEVPAAEPATRSRAARLVQRAGGRCGAECAAVSRESARVRRPVRIGVAGAGQTRIKTTLLPPEIANARKIRKKKPWAVAAAAVLLAGL